MIQTRQRLVCHRRADAGIELEVAGAVTARYDKRGRTYVDIEVTVTGSDDPQRRLWTSVVSFTPTATLGATA